MNAVPKTEHIVYIGLGSNIKPEKNLPQAIEALRAQSELLAVSSAWKSPPVGSQGPDFLNAAAKLTTTLSADELKANMLRPIEADLGRVRGSDRNAPRTIDLDVLIFDGEELEPGIWDYAYLALPLSEIASEHISQVTGETLAEAVTRLRENQTIERVLLKAAKTKN